jgi:hypothetical protein
LTKRAVDPRRVEAAGEELIRLDLIGASSF